jgi:hypothetical protein
MAVEASIFVVALVKEIGRIEEAVVLVQAVTGYIEAAGVEIVAAELASGTEDIRPASEAN